MIFGDTKCLPIYNQYEQEAQFHSVPANTVIIDQRLLDEEAEHRYRFTGAHEAGHGIFHPDYFGYNKNQLSFFGSENSLPMVKCRTASVVPVTASEKSKLSTDHDWMEWQANYFASALLMPKSAVFQVADQLKEDAFSRDFYLVKAFSEIFNVSNTAAELRLTPRVWGS